MTSWRLGNVSTVTQWLSHILTVVVVCPTYMSALSGFTRLSSISSAVFVNLFSEAYIPFAEILIDHGARVFWGGILVA